jgi:antitoxin YefM
MKQIPLFEAKNKLSTFVHLAEQGERIEITRHGKTAAVLVGAEALPFKDDNVQSPFFIAYTDFRKNLKGFLDRVTDDADSVIINRPEGKAVVIISMEEYESLKETQYILSSRKMREIIRKGEADIREGNYKVVDPDEL